MAEHSEPATKYLLHAGCGEKNPNKVPKAYRDGTWHEVRLDIEKRVAPDIIADIRDLHPVISGTFDAVFSSHMVEHLYPHDVPVAFAEMLRVLKPGGHALLFCPDLQQVAEIIAKGNLTEPIYTAPAGPVAPIDILYGFRPALARGDLYMAHKSGFTPASLKEVMTGAGFSNVTVGQGPNLLEIKAIGYKPEA